ncbi:HpcH/HpaI aldolase/citrate lyase family protein [Nakamurella deserti]|uniref:HpcH/HpaI aldolase/citrate lyase family protein n=1 Tax=Nakamurella deserti TaxID=2164074 RepID=UPI000DBE3DCA|nr:CoA ester lyase [Nakamurella deserti]
MTVAGAVTVLFVPGDRPDRFDKALGAGADLVVVDLEDAVAPAAKAAARGHVAAALRPGDRRFAVRLNPLDGPEREADHRLLDELTGHPDSALQAVMVPKADDPAALAAIADRLARAFDGPVPLIALVESARGVLAAPALAAVGGVTRLAFGALDLAADVGASSDPGPLLGYARAQVVLASRAARIAGPLDSPPTEIADLAAVTAAARSARGMGFTGSLCIHPAQLPAVRDAFAPTAAELAWARRVVAAGDSAVQVDGRMVDRPVTERARRLLGYAPPDSGR